MCTIRGSKGKGGCGGVIQYGICYGSVEMRGVGGWFNKVERVGKEEGWRMPISAVNVLTSNMGLIA